MAGYRVGYKAGLGDGVSLAGIRWDYCIALVQSKSDSVADPVAAAVSTAQHPRTRACVSPLVVLA